MYICGILPTTTTTTIVKQHTTHTQKKESEKRKHIFVDAKINLNWFIFNEIRFCHHTCVGYFFILRIFPYF